MSLRSHIQALSSAARRLSLSGPSACEPNPELEALVTDFARENHADPMRAGVWRFHTGYGPLLVRVEEDSILGLFINPVGAVRAYKALPPVDAKGRFCFLGFRSWTALMKCVGAVRTP